MAIALAGLCKRAGRPAPPEEIRAAAARLSPSEDDALLALCAGDPPASPLSALAVIDILRGRPAAEAARLEEQGYYAAQAEESSGAAAAGGEEPAAGAATTEQQEPRSDAAAFFQPTLAEQRERFLAATAGAATAAEAAERLGLASEAALRRAAAKLGILSELVRLIPVKPPRAAPPATGPARPQLRSRVEVEARHAAEEQPAAPVPEAPKLPPPGRTPATPVFGRFIGGAAQKRPFAELLAPEGREVLEQLAVELRGNRKQIAERLELLYSREDRRPLAEGELERLLARHGLASWFVTMERENLRGLLRIHRGYLPPVLRALHVSRRELDKMLARFNLEGEAAELLQRARDEALAEQELPVLLERLVAKEEQLRESGILDELSERARQPLLAAVERAAALGQSRVPSVVLELARRELGIELRTFRKAAYKLGLLQATAALLGVELPPESAPPVAPSPRKPPRAPGGKPARGGARPGGAERPAGAGGPPSARKLYKPKPAAPRGGERPPRFDRQGAPPTAPRPPANRPDLRGAGAKPVRVGPAVDRRPVRPRKPTGDRPRTFERPGGAKPAGDRPRTFDRPGGAKPAGDRPRTFARPGGGKPAGDRPRSFERPGGAKPAGDRPRSFDRPGRARPAGDRPHRGGERPGRPRPAGGRPSRPGAPRGGSGPRGRGPA